MPAAESINPILVHALHWDNAEEFCSVLQENGHWQWPRDSLTSDYELLMKAIKLGRKRITNLLLDKGAEVFKNGCKSTPLHLAVKLIGWNDIIERLIALGAKVATQNSNGNTVLHQAFQHRAPYHVMEMLLKAYAKESKMDKKNRYGLAFLHIVSTHNNTKYLHDYLAVYETDINAQVSMVANLMYAGYTALHFAVAYNQYENAKILLENGAEIYWHDANGSTPLHLALERHNTKIIDLLFTYDESNRNIVNNMGLSHFMAACAGNDINIVEQFLHIAQTTGCKSYYPLINSRVSDNLSYSLGGYTPLHFAAQFGQWHILRGLVIIGADPCALTSTKMTPFMLAAKQQHTHVCFLMQHICEYACDENFYDATNEDVNNVKLPVMENMSTVDLFDYMSQLISDVYNNNEVS